MIVGLFNDSFEPIMDGVGVCVRNYAESLAKRSDCRPYVVTSSVPDYVDTAPFPVLRFMSVPIPKLAPYRAGIPALDPEFLFQVWKVPFDLVHAHCPFVSGSIALRIARRRRIPIVTTFHSKYREDLRKALYFEKTADLALSFILRYYDAVDYVWVPNNATGQTLREYGYEGDYEIFPNGVDIPVPTEEEYLRYRSAGGSRAGVSAEEFVFLFVGQHRWEKNVRLIIESMKVLRDRGVAYRMVFAGAGNAEKEMKKLVAALKVADRVRFLGQLLDREGLKELYARADLFLFPSMYDNAPLVVREAAAFALPSVLAKGSSAAEGVVDGENGFLAENSIEAFSDKLTQIMRDPATRSKAGLGARRSIYVSWEQVVAKVHARYREILAAHRA